MLSAGEPAGFTTFAVLQNLEWIAVRPLSLAIRGAKTAWPGAVNAPIAVVDTGSAATSARLTARSRITAYLVPRPLNPDVLARTRG